MQSFTFIEPGNSPETKALEYAAEDYHAVFGVYPKTIIGDRAYPIRDNRQWC